MVFVRRSRQRPHLRRQTRKTCKFLAMLLVTALYSPSIRTFALSVQPRPTSPGATNRQAKAHLVLLRQAARSNEETLTYSSSASTKSANLGAETASIVGSPSTPFLVQDQQRSAYQKGLFTIGGITLLFASNSPVLHAVYTNGEGVAHPPVLLINAAVALVALGACWFGNVISLATSDNIGERQGDQTLMEESVSISILSEKELSDPGLTQAPVLQSASPALQQSSALAPFQFLFGATHALSAQAGAELGLYKFLGTLCNIYGLSLTSSTHGALLIQLTTLLVPIAQGLQGVPIPKRIWTAIGLALGGVYLFTMTEGNVVDDVANAMALQGDVACILAAVFYATYDLRLFHYGKLVDAAQLITNKILVQTSLAVLAAAILAGQDSAEYLGSFVQSSDGAADVTKVILACMWSGIAVNAVAPYLQVGGQQAIGPVRAQIIYASQPLWAAGMSFICLGETIGTTGLIGGGAFLMAMMLAATAEVPDPNCPENVCEV